MAATRRTFLKLTGGTGVGLLLCPNSLLAGYDPLWKPGTVPERPIDTSVFELFKIGPGPSSSHTIAPMKAGTDFLRLASALPPKSLGTATKVTVRLYGSLCATGKGHGTDRAVAAGLLGQEPETCDADFLDALFAQKDEVRTLTIGPASIPLRASDIVFDESTVDAPYSNVLRISLSGAGGTLAEREYYSVGGGFLQWKGWTAPERGTPKYAFDSMNGLLEMVSVKGIPLPRLILENEMALTGKSEKDIRDGLMRLIKAMDASVVSGLKREGKLKGPFGMDRRAASMLREAEKSPLPEERFTASLSAYAHAAAEENADGHPIVTAPTAGSAGVMPAVVHILLHTRHIPEEQIQDGMLAAAAVGMLVKRHASIAGADVGCQGEIGVASAMSAALIAQVSNGEPAIVENAAELALEHHLGLTCDPVGGYVQIPCISRCAMGAVKAWNAYLMAQTGRKTAHPVGLDLTIRTMAATGKDMDPRYRETSQGGLALFYTQGC